MKKRLAFILIPAALALALFSYFVSRPPDLDFPAGSATTVVDFTIAPGETGSQIAHALAKAGVVKTWESFFNVAAADKRSLTLQPGTRKIHLWHWKSC
jgi:cell division protein YceG involved in septum cleavage